MSKEIVVRKCEGMEEFHRCVELQRRIWEEADVEVEPATMFAVAAHTGGQTLGAFDGERLVGFTLAVAGLRGRSPYLHSHMTGVDSEYRNRGIGRMLKLFQREEALGRGIRLIQWTFDPLELRNAHFNLNRLGVICRDYLPNLYGVTTSPLHRGLPTDRLVAEWWIDSVRVKEILAGNLPPANPGVQRISVAANISELKSRDRASGARVQALTRTHFLELFAKEYVATGVDNRGHTTDYLLEPRDSVAGVHLPELTPD